MIESHSKPEFFSNAGLWCLTELLAATINLIFHVMWKSHEIPNPLTPFPMRERGNFKVSLLLGERFRERFSRSREKSEPLTKVICLKQLVLVNLDGIWIYAMLY